MEGGVTGMEGLTGAITSLLDLAGTFITTILANPVLALFFAAGVVGIVIGIVKKLTRV